MSFRILSKLASGMHMTLLSRNSRKEVGSVFMTISRGQGPAPTHMPRAGRERAP